MGTEILDVEEVTPELIKDILDKNEFVSEEEFLAEVAEVEKKEAKLIDIPGVGVGTVAKLQDAGVYDIMGLATMTPSQLNVMTGMSESVSRKAIHAARDLADMGFNTASEQEEKDKNLSYISFGSKNLDNLLGGRGIRTKSITEAFGNFGSGKTQLAIALAVQAVIPKEGEKQGKVIYIDTEGAFRTDRVRQFADGAGIDQQHALNNILVARAYNSDHQMLLMDKVTEIIKDGENIKLIIIDSLTAHFRSEYAGRGKLADRQQKMNRYIHNIQKIADVNNIAVYVTNQVMSDPAQMFGDPTKPVGGNIVGHASAYRIYLRRGAKDSRIAKLIDAPDLPDNATAFMVETNGFKDIVA